MTAGLFIMILACISLFLAAFGVKVGGVDLMIFGFALVVLSWVVDRFPKRPAA